MIVLFFMYPTSVILFSTRCHARFIVLAIIELSVAGSGRSRTTLSLSKGRTLLRCVMLLSVSLSSITLELA